MQGQIREIYISWALSVRSNRCFLKDRIPVLDGKVINMVSLDIECRLSIFCLFITVFLLSFLPIHFLSHLPSLFSSCLLLVYSFSFIPSFHGINLPTFQIIPSLLPIRSLSHLPSSISSAFCSFIYTVPFLLSIALILSISFHLSKLFLLSCAFLPETKLISVHVIWNFCFYSPILPGKPKNFTTLKASWKTKLQEQKKKKFNCSSSKRGNCAFS